MKWIDVENVVVGYVRERFITLSRKDPAKFTREFSLAYEQLKNLNQNPDYDLPLIGDAYCLKYHLLRMDNLTTALDYVHKVRPLLQSLKSEVLDMGGGTGGSAMAIAKTCNDLTGTYPLGESFGKHPDDRPYYGFYGTVEAFTHSPSRPF